jgi:hypothetical protein
MKTPSKYSETPRCIELTLPEKGKRKQAIPTARQTNPVPKYNLQKSNICASSVFV